MSVSQSNYKIGLVRVRADRANVLLVSVLLAGCFYDFADLIVMLAGARHINHISQKIVISILGIVGNHIIMVSYVEVFPGKTGCDYSTLAELILYESGITVSIAKNYVGALGKS